MRSFLRTAACALFLALPPSLSPAFAQEDPDLARTVARLVAPLQARIAELEKDVKELEDRIVVLEEPEPQEPEEEEKPAEFRAPFTIVDGLGRTILEVQAQTGGGTLKLNGADGTNIDLSASSTATVSITSGDRSVEIGGLKDGHGLVVNEGGLSNAELTDRNDGRYALRIGEDSQNLLTAGFHNSGRVALTLWEGDNELARLDGGEAGSDGRLRLGSGDKVVEAAAALADGASGFFVGPSAKPVAELADRASLAALRVRDAGGNMVLQAGRHSEGWPGISIQNGSTDIVRLRPAEGGAVGTLQLFQGGNPAIVLGQGADLALGLLVTEPSGRNVLAGFPIAGSPQVSLSEADSLIALLGPSDKLASAGALHLFMGSKPQISLDGGPLPEINMWSGADAPVVNLAAVSDSASLSILGGGELLVNVGRLYGSERNGVEVMEGSAPVATLSSDEEGGHLRIKNASAEEAAFLGSINGGTELAIYHSSGQVARLGSVPGQPEAGSLELLKSAALIATLGSTSQKPLPAVRIYDEGEPAFAAGVAGTGISAMSVYSGGEAVGSLQAMADGNSALLIQAGGNVVASVNSIDAPGQGIVAVYNSAGQSVARLGEGTNGGGNITTTDPAGMGVFSAGYNGEGPGAACVLSGGMKCLGIGLTGMEGFHSP